MVVAHRVCKRDTSTWAAPRVCTFVDVYTYTNSTQKHSIYHDEPMDTVATSCPRSNNVTSKEKLGAVRDKMMHVSMVAFTYVAGVLCPSALHTKESSLKKELPSTVRMPPLIGRAEGAK